MCGSLATSATPAAARLTYLGPYALQHLGHERAGTVAVGHTRYSTTGSTVLANAQPCNVATRCGPLAIAHNGNIINATELKRELVDKGAIFTTSSDTEVLVHLIARSKAHTVEGQIRDALEQVDGAYSLVITVGRTLY